MVRLLTPDTPPVWLTVCPAPTVKDVALNVPPELIWRVPAERLPPDIVSEPSESILTTLATSPMDDARFNEVPKISPGPTSRVVGPTLGSVKVLVPPTQALGSKRRSTRSL